MSRPRRVSATRWTRRIADLTLAEQIVWLFLERITEAHRDSVILTLRTMTEERFSRAIPEARDLGIRTLKGSTGVGVNPRTGGPPFGPDGKVVGPIYLTPIYDRPGWWTARPTRFLVARALEESRKRNEGEQKREARIYGQTFGAPIAAAVNYGAGSINAQLLTVQTLSALKADPAKDPILRAVDLVTAKSNGTRLHVAR